MRFLGLIPRLLSMCVFVHGFGRIPLPREDTNGRVVTIHSSGETKEGREVAILDNNCGKNEVWYSCLPPYPITCENLYRTGRSKGSDCLKGCDCVLGFVRKYIGSPCVPIEHCSDRIHPEEKYSYVEECPRHEVFSTCGSSCAEKCNNDRKRVCPVVCEEGCFCRPGYVRQKNGKCVNSEICLRDSIEERICSSREIYRTCGRRSDERCHSGPKSSGCESGCFCKSGYVRIGGHCVRRSSACGESQEQKCGDHEEWTKCGRSCQDECIDWSCRIDNRGCEARCRCKPGYKRIRGRCVEVSQCLFGSSRNCTGENEVHRARGQPCDELCDRGSCNEPAKAGCFCRENFYRIDKVCRPATSCSVQQCVKPNEKYKCARQCQEQCSPCEPGSDCEWGCYCDVGFVRSNSVLECIAASACLGPAAEENVEEAGGGDPTV